MLEGSINQCTTHEFHGAREIGLLNPSWDDTSASAMKSTYFNSRCKGSHLLYFKHGINHSLISTIANTLNEGSTDDDHLSFLKQKAYYLKSIVLLKW
jgi:hypothetical protein